MSNLSDYTDAHKQLEDKIAAAEGILSDNDMDKMVRDFYSGAIALTLVKIADDIHEISRTLKEMNRRRS